MTIIVGDALEVLSLLVPDESVQCVVTSPPYFGLRDYGIRGQLGLEPTVDEFAQALVGVMREVRRTLAKDGVLWLNLGDSYNAYNGNRGASRTGLSRNDPMPSLPTGAGLSDPSLPNKSLLMVPARVAIAMQLDGWVLRNEIVWAKTNGMPSSVKDRLTNKHESLFLFSKTARYRFNLDAIRQPHVRTWEPGKNGGRSGWDRGDHLNAGLSKAAPHPLGKNPGDVWSIATVPFSGAHFATMPPKLAERCILAGSDSGETVLDPFVGAGTTTVVAEALGRQSLGIELNPEYAQMARDRPRPKLETV